MAAQDDAREREMTNLFNLVQAPDRRRADVDAVLELDGASVPEHLRGQRIDFELKSSTSGKPSFSTVRDFGPHYIAKWSRMHWLFGVYAQQEGGLRLQYCLYGSPKAMKPWFDRMSAYVSPDFKLRELVPDLLGVETLAAVIGDQESYSYDDAKRLMKNQYSRSDYDRAADLSGGRYSRAAMLEMLRKRCAYVIARGSTLNNPHIPAPHFDGWEQIKRDHAARLRELVIASYDVPE